MTKQTEALKLAQAALSASDDFLFNYHDCEPNNEREVDAYSEVRGNNMKAWEAIREALAEESSGTEQPAQKRPQNCGTSYCSCIECVMEPEHPAIKQDLTPEQPAQQQEQFTEDAPADCKRLAEHGAPICGRCHMGPCKYTTPQPQPAQREWVGLTDDEVAKNAAQGHRRWIEFARAIEAELKEKNK